MDDRQRWNSVAVAYTDASGARAEALVEDLGPQNPCNAARITRRARIELGTATFPAAVQVGTSFLAEQNRGRWSRRLRRLRWRLARLLRRLHPQT